MEVRSGRISGPRRLTKPELQTGTSEAVPSTQRAAQAKSCLESPGSSWKTPWGRKKNQAFPEWFLISFSVLRDGYQTHNQEKGK